MRIKHLTLRDYIRFRVSKIYTLSVNTDEDIQLIIGSNGSGKSSILHELFPYPPNKSSFGKNGYKSLCIEHNNDEYELIYDTNSGHKFIKNGVNLNIGKTYDIQRELILDHFGITNDIHTILKCALNICDMVPSVRKKILMNLNPVDISIFLEKYQKVHKDAIAYGNNLDRLYTRQKELMMKKLPEQQYQDMLKKKAILDNQEKLLLMWITSVTAELNKFTTNESYTTNIPMRHDIKNIVRSLSKYSTIKRSSLSSKITELSVLIDVYSKDLQAIEESIIKTVKAINDHEAKKIFLEKDVDNVSNEIALLKKKLIDFTFPEHFTPISKDAIQSINLVATRIMEILVNITYIEYNKIVPFDDLQNMRSNIMQIRYELSNEQNILNRLRENHEEVLKSIRLYSIPDNCQKNDCELFKVYNENQLIRKNKLDKLNGDIMISSKKFDDLQEKCDLLNNQYDIQLRIWNNLNDVLTIINENSYLKSKFNRRYILEKTNESALGVYNDIIQLITFSESYHEYTDLQEKLHKLELINASIISKKQISLEMMESDIVRTKSILDKQRDEFDKKNLSINTSKDSLGVLLQFSNERTRAQEILTEISDTEEKMITTLSREYLNKLLEIMSSLLNEVRSELIDITNICKEQELLLARLNTEIDAVIHNIKPLFEKAKIIEKSLAELPVQYTKNFINAIIETANYFINEIMTYSMKLIPIGEHEECSFQFPVIINDEVPTKDISLCSDGQRAIIQLAFNLAIVVELRFNNYPIFCDEYNRTLDSMHSQRLTDMLLNLMRSKIATQLFTVNHDRSMIEQLSHTGNVIVLDSKNIDLPDVYNKNVQIEYV